MPLFGGVCLKYGCSVAIWISLNPFAYQVSTLNLLLPNADISKNFLTCLLLLLPSGERGACHKHVCHFGAICVVKSGYAICECPSCSEEFEPVCGTDGISYTNICKLKQEGCDQKTNIDVAYTGLCSLCVKFPMFVMLFCGSGGLKDFK
ncbi:kazal-like domain-containing protein [Caerostris extrusa]|uniref:Kazal-like domain-containing protein n=1 Tax=Caerostris extrusa TaxID=172846 RepID=A0AAV4N5A7_CAEEX|nr:kazal-like domain-containing protein [Caerostris extrusa]